MPLEDYRRKRDFASTPEPAGMTRHAEKGALTFVVHKHASRALHYDLRLEIGGVYASWAVPKGPSLDPADKHLAVHVEDHPLEYGSFEGTIPAGEYGAGTVMIWDRGTFSPVGDPAEGVVKGDFKFVLDGTKLKGQWVLVRMKPRPGDKRENWLFIKERDDAVRPRAEYDILAAEPDSAATGRTMEQIAAGAPGSGTPLGARLPPTPSQRAVSAGVRNRSSRVPDPGATDLPTDAPFQLATLVDEAPAGPEWIHEVKFDGYRLHVAVEDGRGRVLTRNGADWTERFPGIAMAAEALPVSSVVLDGEAVVLDKDGRSDFGLLQDALASGQPGRVIYEVFDLLYLDGFDLRAETLLRRKDLLASLLSRAPADGALRLVEHYSGDGIEYHSSSCKLLLEGSVSKRGDRPWVPGRTRDWLKAKCLARQEFVVGGWTDPEGSRQGFGALLLGAYDPGGKLRYTGRVGTGFTERTLVEIGDRLKELATDDPPFADPPHPAHLHWVRPDMVVEVAFREWTHDGILRQPSFKGVRDDKAARDVVRESPAPASQASADPAEAVPTPVDDEPPIEVGGVTITHPSRRLEPAGITKADLALYYEAVSEWMLPHIVGRLLTLVRCPHGESGETGCFYQKHPEARGWPDSLKPVTIRDSDGPALYSYVEDEAGLLALAQLGTLEIHVWNSMASDPERPDRIVFDLDPGPEVAFADVAAGARTVRDALGALGLAAFVKTTGGHGLHVVTPIVPDRTYDDVRAFAHGLVSVLAAQRPDLFTALMAKSQRPGRVFVDYLRNAHGATAVCAYSTRARPGARVSVPVAWQRLTGLDPSTYDTVSVPRRLAALRNDPWDGYEKSRRALTDEMFAALGVGDQPAPRSGSSPD
jgi:bifunctional non-homologous end joining protein LigD